MNITIDSQDPLYKEVISSGLTAIELVRLGLKTTMIIKSKIKTQDLNKKELEPYEDRDNKNAELKHLEILNEIRKINLNIGGSSKKGKIAEDIIFNNLCEYFPHAEIINTSNSARKGDLIIKIEGYSIMIELKNYNKNVPTKEKNKFYRDVNSNDYDAAILASCSSGIAGIKNRFHYEMEKNVLLLYLSNAGNNGFSILWGIMFIISSLNMKKSSNEKNNCGMNIIFNIVNSQLKGLEYDLDILKNIKENILQGQIDTIRTIELSTSRTLINVDKLNTRIQNQIIEINKIFSIKESDSNELKSSIDIKEPSIKKTILSREELQLLKVNELKELGKKYNINKLGKLNKKEIIDTIIENYNS